MQPFSTKSCGQQASSRYTWSFEASCASCRFSVLNVRASARIIAGSLFGPPGRARLKFSDFKALSFEHGQETFGIGTLKQNMLGKMKLRHFHTAFIFCAEPYRGLLHWAGEAGGGRRTGRRRGASAKTGRAAGQGGNISWA